MKQIVLLVPVFFIFQMAFAVAGKVTSENITEVKRVDSVKAGDNRNMLLNAESATVPREINIGLPENGSGAIVYVDGTKHSQGLSRSQFHWQSGNSYLPVKSISLMEAVITTGEIGVLVDSHTKLGGEKIQGDFSIGTSSFGQIRFDGNVNGPISTKKRWYYSVGAFINYDPTGVNAPSRTFVDQKQVYNLALSKRWSNAELNFIYRFSLCDDSIDGVYSKAPFIYNGDGSTSSYKDFRIGKDCYFPADDKIQYMDIVTGEYKEKSMGKMDHRLLHDVSVTGRYDFDNGWSMLPSIHLCIFQPSQQLKMSISGIDDSSSGQYSLTDGSAYSGKVQNRFATIDDLYTYDLEAVLTAERKWTKNKLKLGFSGIYSYQHEAGSTVYFAHETNSNPARILKNGQMSWSFNKSGQYFEGCKYGAAFYAVDDWNITKRLLSRTGVRIKPTVVDVMSAAQLDGEEKNKRVDGFNIADPNLCNLHNIKTFGVDYAFSQHFSYRLIDRLFAMAEGFYSMTSKTTTYYKNATIPSTKPIGNALGSAGLMYDNSWVDATFVATYITSWNNAKIMSVSKQVGGVSETIPWTAQYGIGTWGCTLDANFKYRGFKFHTLFTWQDPRYKNYRNEFVFSDGSKTVIDYTDKYVTGISQIMVELDPSYSWKKYRVWASIRYYSRQYASRTNYAYFNGHFESFAGVDVGFTDSSKISLNFTNILFQNGVKGTLDIADTIEDPSLLTGYLMAGSYIRPFEIQLSYTYHF